MGEAMKNHLRVISLAGLVTAGQISVASAQTSTSYGYDAQGRLVKVEDSRGIQASFAFDPAGNRRQVSIFNQFLQSWNGAAAELGNVVGRREGDGWSARVEDAAGHMVYGPYVNGIPAGARVASFRMMVDNNSASNSDVVRLDVYDATAGTELAARQVRRLEWRSAYVYQTFEVPFTIAASQVSHTIEFRIYYQRSSYVKVEKVGYR